MKPLFLILLAAMTAWIALTAHEIDNAHQAAGRPSKTRAVQSENPALRQLHTLVEAYGARQVFLGLVGIAAGLFLALTIALKILKLLALACVAILVVVIWLAWDRGYLMASLPAPPTLHSSSPWA